MIEKMSDEQFYNILNAQGGLLEAVFNYGLHVSDLEEDSIFLDAMQKLEAVRGAIALARQSFIEAAVIMEKRLDDKMYGVGEDDDE